MKVNTLVRVSHSFNSRAKKWLIPVDRTPASLRAVDYAIRLSGPEDHLILIHVREIPANRKRAHAVLVRHGLLNNPYQMTCTSCMQSIVTLLRYVLHTTDCSRRGSGMCPASGTLLGSHMFDIQGAFRVDSFAL